MNEEYGKLVEKYGMRPLYNNAVECMVIGHYLICPERIPELDAAGNHFKTSGLKVFADCMLCHEGYKYRLIPERKILGCVPHGASIDGRIIEG